MPPELYDYELIQDKSAKIESDSPQSTTSSFVCNNPMRSLSSEATPVVFVEGFLSPGKPAYWGPLEKIFASSNYKNNEKKLKSRQCIFVFPGCGSSLHDRAIEIFYQIKGGRGN